MRSKGLVGVVLGGSSRRTALLGSPQVHSENGLALNDALGSTLVQLFSTLGSGKFGVV